MTINTSDGSVDNIQFNGDLTEIGVDYSNFNQDLENQTDEFTVQLEFKPLREEFGDELDQFKDTDISESPLTNSADAILAIEFSPDKSYLAYASDDKNVYVHNVGGNWELVETLTQVDEDYAEGLAFSNNSNLIAYSGRDEEVYIHNVGGNWELVETLTEPTDSIITIEFSQDDSKIAYGGWDDTVYIHNTSDWNLEESLTQADNVIYSVVFSNNDSLIAYGSTDNNAYIHNTSDWSLEQTLTESNDGSIYSFSFNSDDSLLAYSSRDNNVYIHETSNWNLEQTLTSSDDNVWAVEFSQDDSYIAYGSSDNNVYIHETSNWSLDQTLTLESNGGRSLDFIGDDFVIAYGGFDDNVYIHRKDTAVPQFEEILSDTIDAGSTECEGECLGARTAVPTPRSFTPSDTVMSPLSDFSGVGLNFNQHSNISFDYQMFEYTGGSDFEYRLTVYSNSYDITATDNVILSIDVN